MKFSIHNINFDCSDCSSGTFYICSNNKHVVAMGGMEHIGSSIPICLRIKELPKSKNNICNQIFRINFKYNIKMS